MSDGEDSGGEDLVERPEDVVGYLSPEKLDSILEEIVTFEVNLAEDPTLPDLGLRYLQKQVAQCRQFLNRVQYYLQTTKRYEKNLKRAAKVFELDVELKLANKLADDPVVRRQSAVADRKAVAISMLNEEHRVLARFQVEIQNLDDTIRLVKSKYDDLRHTSADIKLQRQLVKDDMAAWGSGEDGYTNPQSRQDKTIPGGMPPPVRAESIDPQDLLDDSRRPEDLPKPRNMSHAKSLASFYGRKPSRDAAPAPPESGGVEEPPKEEPAKTAKTVSYEDLLK